jgi:hypothetical protein
MIDSLLSRAQLAIDESHALRARKRGIITQFEEASQSLRLAIFESAMIRTEVKAYRDDRA